MNFMEFILNLEKLKANLELLSKFDMQSLKPYISNIEEEPFDYRFLWIDNLLKTLPRELAIKNIKIQDAIYLTDLGLDLSCDNWNNNFLIENPELKIEFNHYYPSPTSAVLDINYQIKKDYCYIKLKNRLSSDFNSFYDDISVTVRQDLDDVEEFLSFDNLGTKLNKLSKQYNVCFDIQYDSCNNGVYVNQINIPNSKQRGVWIRHGEKTGLNKLRKLLNLRREFNLNLKRIFKR